MIFSTPFGNFLRGAFSFFDSVKMLCDERLEILFIRALGFQQLIDPYEFIKIRIEGPEWYLISTHFSSYHLVSCFFVTDHILMRIPERRKICCPVSDCRLMNFPGVMRLIGTVVIFLDGIRCQFRRLA